MERLEENSFVVNRALNLPDHHWDHWAFVVLRLDCLRFPGDRDQHYNRISGLNPLGQRWEFALEHFPVPVMCCLATFSICSLISMYFS